MVNDANSLLLQNLTCSNIRRDEEPLESAHKIELTNENMSQIIDDIDRKDDIANVIIELDKQDEDFKRNHQRVQDSEPTMILDTVPGHDEPVQKRIMVPYATLEKSVPKFQRQLQKSAASKSQSSFRPNKGGLT